MLQQQQIQMGLKPQPPFKVYKVIDTTTTQQREVSLVRAPAPLYPKDGGINNKNGGVGGGGLHCNGIGAPPIPGPQQSGGIASSSSSKHGKHGNPSPHHPQQQQQHHYQPICSCGAAHCTAAASGGQPLMMGHGDSGGGFHFNTGKIPASGFDNYNKHNNVQYTPLDGSPQRYLSTTGKSNDDQFNNNPPGSHKSPGIAVPLSSPPSAIPRLHNPQHHHHQVPITSPPLLAVSGNGLGGGVGGGGVTSNSNMSNPLASHKFFSSYPTDYSQMEKNNNNSHYHESPYYSASAGGSGRSPLLQRQGFDSYLYSPRNNNNNSFGSGRPSTTDPSHDHSPLLFSTPSYRGGAVGSVGRGSGGGSGHGGGGHFQSLPRRSKDGDRHRYRGLSLDRHGNFAHSAAGKVNSILVN